MCTLLINTFPIYESIIINYLPNFFEKLKEFKFNFIKALPEITKYITLLNDRCKGDSLLTLTYEQPGVYTDYGVQINSKKGESKTKTITKTITKKTSNRKFENSTLYPPTMQDKSFFNNRMILCLNKKNKLKYQHERECISSIQHYFALDSHNNLKISIESKTLQIYEGNKYNKILILFLILIIHYFVEKYKLFTKYEAIIVNDIYIESQEINPIYVFLLLQIGFMAVHQKTNNIDKELTERLKSMSVEQLQGELQHNFKNGIHTRYNINKMSQDDVKNIKQQITSLIIGKIHNNTNTLKCLDNKNNTIKNITNIN